MTTTPRVYARPVAFIYDDANTIGSYTLHREYEVFPMVGDRADFLIVGDNGEVIPCWWHGDPDVIWERVER